MAKKKTATFIPAPEPKAPQANPNPFRRMDADVLEAEIQRLKAYQERLEERALIFGRKVEEQAKELDAFKAREHDYKYVARHGEDKFYKLQAIVGDFCDELSKGSMIGKLIADKLLSLTNID